MENQNLSALVGTDCSVLQRELDIRFLDLTTDLGVPVVGCVIFDKNGEFSPASSFGSAAALTFRDAVAKSFCEAVHTWQWMSELTPNARVKGFSTISEEIAKPKEMMLHALYYTFEETLEVMQKFAGSIETVRYSLEKGKSQGSKEQLRSLLEVLSQNGHDVFRVSANRDMLPEIGIWSEKVLVPSLALIGVGTMSKPLGHPRIRKYIYENRSPKFNPHPHPLP
jgi:ribosomal protein S12 methylthiotransferase accessory factor YcaO